METLESSMKMNHVTSLSSSFKSRTYREEYFTIFSFLQMKCQPDAEKSHQLLIQNNFFHNLVQVYRIVLQMFKREVIYELSSVFIGREMSRKRKHNRKHFTLKSILLSHFYLKLQQIQQVHIFFFEVINTLKRL